MFYVSDTIPNRSDLSTIKATKRSGSILKGFPKHLLQVKHKLIKITYRFFAAQTSFLTASHLVQFMLMTLGDGDGIKISNLYFQFRRCSTLYGSSTEVQIISDIFVLLDKLYTRTNSITYFLHYKGTSIFVYT